VGARIAASGGGLDARCIIVPPIRWRIPKPTRAAANRIVSLNDIRGCGFGGWSVEFGRDE